MENQMTELRCERCIDMVVTEIKTICEQVRQYVLVSAVEIGRRLVEAKEMLPHGSWGAWITENFEFSHRQANLFMELFEGYGSDQATLFGAELKSQTFSNLSYTKALKLLALPEEERENFVKENDVDGMSTRELEKVIKERDEALKKAEETEALRAEITENEENIKALKEEREKFDTEKEALSGEVEELKKKLEKAKQSEKNAKDKLKNIKENPEIPEEVMERINKEASEKAFEEEKKRTEELIKEAEEKIRLAEKAKQEAENKLKYAEDKADELEKQLKMSNPAITEFKALFEQTQQDLQKLMRALQNINDKDVADKFKNAIGAMCKQYIKEE